MSLTAKYVSNEELIKINLFPTQLTAMNLAMKVLFFPARTKGPYKPMKTTAIYNCLLKLKKRLGIKRRVCLHLLRHLRALRERADTVLRMEDQNHAGYLCAHYGERCTQAYPRIVWDRASHEDT